MLAEIAAYINLFPVQNLRQLLRQFFHLEGLLNKTIATSIHYFGSGSIHAVPAEKEDLYTGIDLFHPVIRITATHKAEAAGQSKTAFVHLCFINNPEI